MNKYLKPTPGQLGLILIMLIATPVFIIQKVKQKSSIKTPVQAERKRPEKIFSKPQIIKVSSSSVKKSPEERRTQKKFLGIKPRSKALTQDEKKTTQKIIKHLETNKRRYKNMPPSEIAEAIENELGIGKRDLRDKASAILARIREKEKLKAEQLESLLKRISLLNIESVDVDTINESVAVSLRGFPGKGKDPFDQQTKRKLVEIMALVFREYPQIDRLELSVCYPAAENKIPQMSYLDVNRSIYSQIDRQASAEEIIRQLSNMSLR